MKSLSSFDSEQGRNRCRVLSKGCQGVDSTEAEPEEKRCGGPGRAAVGGLDQRKGNG